jgi:hypothetical protein
MPLTRKSRLFFAKTSAVLLLLISELSLRIFPLRYIAEAVHQWRKFRIYNAPIFQFIVRRVARELVTINENFIFLKPSCLRLSLAQMMLSPGPTQIHIGVKRSGASKLAAHAWVESDASTQEFLEIAAL